MTTGCLIGLVAETPVHVGIGQANEAIDLPVAREKTTHIPHVPGSGVKGALRVWAGGTDLDINQLFGTDTTDEGSDRAAGTILCGEARLALLPVRCTSDSYKWVTCPLIINRLIRDMQRFNMPINMPNSMGNLVYQVADGYHRKASGNNTPLGLEEREFTYSGDIDDAVINLFAPLVGDAFDRATLKAKIVILSDEDFVWFAQFGLPVAMRNRLNEHKIVDGGGLWSEETLSVDTVMWMLLGERMAGQVDLVKEKIGGKPYIQMGGNETIGQGWFKMAVAGCAP
jgi:CRISPR-associated protein Cmr4